jgi:hypothetical protein
MYEYGKHVSEKESIEISVQDATDTSAYGYAMVPGKMYGLTFTRGLFTNEQDAVTQAIENVQAYGAVVQYAAVVNGTVYVQCYVPDQTFPGQADGQITAIPVVILGIVVAGIVAAIIVYFVGVALQRATEFTKENEFAMDTIVISIAVASAAVFVLAVAMAYRSIRGDRSFRDTIVIPSGFGE